MTSLSARLIVLCGMVLPAAAQTPNMGVPEIPLAGRKIVFFGDATLQNGNDSRQGFVHLVEQAFPPENPPLFILKADGNTAKDLLGRLKKEVLDQRPDWMLLGCGFYDAAQNTPLDQYRTNLASMLDQAGAAGIKVMILTSIMNGEDQANPGNQKLTPYNDAARELAKEKNLPLNDVNADLQAAVAEARRQVNLAVPGNLLTLDPTHLNGLGREVVAAGMLKVLGFTPAQVAEARDIWLDLPGEMDQTFHYAVSVRQSLKLRELAAHRGLTVNEMLTQALNKDVISLLIGVPHVHKRRK